MLVSTDSGLLRRDPRDPELTPLASEFVGTSISSGGDGTEITAGGI